MPRAEWLDSKTDDFPAQRKLMPLGTTEGGLITLLATLCSVFLQELTPRVSGCFLEFEVPGKD